MIKNIFAATFLLRDIMIKGLLMEINSRDENCYLQFSPQKQEQQQVDYN